MKSIGDQRWPNEQQKKKLLFHPPPQPATKRDKLTTLMAIRHRDPFSHRYHRVRSTLDKTSAVKMKRQCCVGDAPPPSRFSPPPSTMNALK